MTSAKSETSATLSTKFNRHFTDDDWSYINEQLVELQNYNIYPGDIERFYIDNMIKGGNLFYLQNFIKNCKTTTQYSDEELLDYNTLLRSFPNRIPNEKFSFLRFHIIDKRLSFPPLKKLIKRLLRSVYPMEANDFFLIKFRDVYENTDKNVFLKGREVPVDWQLKNFVLFLWDNGLNAQGWDQGFEDIQHGFITVNNSKNEIRKVLKNISEIKIKAYEGVDNAFSLSFENPDLPIIHQKLGIEMPSHKKAFLSQYDFFHGLSDFSQVEN